MLKVKTRTGFECKIDESVMNKYSFVKLLGKIDSNPMLITEVINKLLGDNEDKLIEHLGGDPTTEEMSEALSDIFECIKEHNEAKKS